MAIPEHVEIARQGAGNWNNWRAQNPSIRPNLEKADLSYAKLKRANLREAILWNSCLSSADLRKANLSGAYVTWTDLSDADLSLADLSHTLLQGSLLCRAKLIGANLFKADLRKTDLADARAYKANFTKAILSNAYLGRADLRGAVLSDCRVFGVSAWGLRIDDSTNQQGLIVTPKNEPAVAIDDLEIAQFIYLLLHNEKIRNVIDTIGKKGVLILGRFSKDRKPVLDGLRDELRQRGYVPIVFDFERAASQDFSETIMTLAGMSYFVIADITNPRSAPLELQATVPNYMIPFVPIMQDGEEPFSMFVDLQNKYDWVLPVLIYRDRSQLVEVMEGAIIREALKKHDQLMLKKAKEIQTRHADEYDRA